MISKTVRPERVSTIRETVILASPKATVTKLTPPKAAKRDSDWLMREISSTPYATVLS